MYCVRMRSSVGFREVDFSSPSSSSVWWNTSVERHSELITHSVIVLAVLEHY
jgi:hypothetical protein